MSLVWSYDSNGRYYARAGYVITDTYRVEVRGAPYRDATRWRLACRGQVIDSYRTLMAAREAGDQHLAAGEEESE